MMHALLKLQNSDGLWRSSLLDPRTQWAGRPDHRSSSMPWLGEAITAEDWADYLKKCAGKFLNGPFSDPPKNPNSNGHTLAVPAAIPTPPAPAAP